MNAITRILIPFGFSKSSERAIEYAVDFTQNGQPTEIVLVYVASAAISSVEKQEIEDKFSEIKNKYDSRSSDVVMSHHIETGDFVKNILELKASQQAEIIMMGTHGSQEVSHEVDTNASKLVEEADCPILVIPEKYEGFRIENITLAIDDSEIEDPESLSTLLVIARRYDAKIHVLTIYDEDDKGYLNENKNESILKYYFERYYARDSFVVSSDIAQSIIDYDKRQAIDLLAIIPKNHNKNNKPSQGRLTKFLTKQTAIPVLIID